jgi:hypothetical protein
MANIIIYTVNTEDHYRLGTPSEHLLYEPNISRTWIERAEYEIPEGYYVGSREDGLPEFYRKDDNSHCPLTDSECYGKGGGKPILIDNRANKYRVKFTKIRDLPW